MKNFRAKSKQVLCLLCTLFVVASVFACIGSIPVNAETNTAGHWTETNATGNLIPTLTGDSLVSQGWATSNSNQTNPNGFWEDGVFKIRANRTEDDLGNKEYQGGVYYTIDLSDADQVKANLGQLTMSASSRNYFQASANHYISVRAEFYNASNTLIGSDRNTYHNYYVASRDVNLELSETKVPAGTSYIRVWFSNWGSLSGRPSIWNFKCVLYDRTAPGVTGVTLDKSAVCDPAGGGAIAGDTVKYGVEFNEKLIHVSGGTSYGSAKLSLDGQVIATSTNAEIVTENGKSKVVYTFVLPSLTKNGTLALSSISGLHISDEAKNYYDYSSTSIDSGTLKYYKTMSVTSSLQKITMTGDSSAVYGTDYTATLTPLKGYDLPSTITIRVGGAVLVGANTYTYDASNGKIIIKGNVITDDIRISAFGVAKNSTVTFDAQGGDGGTGSVTATYDSAMPSVILPTRRGYTFGGYYTEKNGSGQQYYDAAGKSVRNFDFETGVTLYAKWTPNRYTVVYNANKPSHASAAVSGKTESSTHTYDVTGTLTKNAYQLTGWRFTGWATSPNGPVVYTDGQAVTNLAAEGSVTLYAVWSANSYSITLDAAGGNGSGILSAAYDSTLPLIMAPSRSGYNFAGYYTKPDGKGELYYTADGEVVDGKTYTVVGDVRLYAYWKPIHYTIELYHDGKYVTTLEDVVYGILQLPSAETLGLSKENYNFAGWNLYGEQNWNMYSADVVHETGLAYKDGETVVLHAAWTEKEKYNIVYDANGGAGAPAMSQAHEGETVRLSESVPTRENYTFLGWSVSSNAATVDYLPGEEFTMGDSIATLYAVWKRNPKLEYSANGGMFVIPQEVVYPVPGNIVVVINDKPVRKGYVFLGWSVSADAEAPEYLGGADFVMPNADTVLYAVWERSEYVITQTVADGYTVNGLEESYRHGDRAEFTVTGTDPKVFINGQRVYAENGKYSCEITGNTNVFIADGSLLYLIYSANGGWGEPVDAGSYRSGVTASVSGIVPVRTGYTFLGWSKNKSATEAEFLPGSAVTFADDDLVLYAVWQANSYSVAYHPGLGSGVMENSSFAFGTPGKLSQNTFVKVGYTFVGWALSDGGRVVYEDMAEIADLSAENGATIHLYAVWERTITTVVFDKNGGTGGSESFSVAYGDALNPGDLIAPKRTGYRFAGYFTEITGGEMIFDAEMRACGAYAGNWAVNEKNMTLYARWTPITYTIVYMQGNRRLGEQQVTYDLLFTLKTSGLLGITAENGFHFAGWSRIPDSTSVVYADGQKITVGLSQNDGDIVYLYTVFSADEKGGVVYNANGGTNAPVDSNRYYVGSTVTIRPMIPQREGYIFLGWSFDPNGGTLECPYVEGEFTVNTVLMQEGGITLYAVWKEGTTLKSQIDALEKKLQDAVTELGNADSDITKRVDTLVEKLAEAQAAIDSLDDIYATDAELADAVAKLEAAIAQAKSELQSKIDEVQSNLDEATERLENLIQINTTDINALRNALAALDEAYKAADLLIKTEFEAANDELTKKIAALETAMRQADEALQDSIDEVQKNLDAAAERFENLIQINITDIDALKTALAELDEAYKAADLLIRRDFKAADDELAARIAALEVAMHQADEALQNSIDEVQKNLDKAAERLENLIQINITDIDALKTALAALDEAYKAADLLIRSDFKAADDELAARIASLEAAMRQADEALQNSIDEVQKNLNAAAERLENLIQINITDIDALKTALAALDEAYKAADLLIRSDFKAADDELAKRIAALEAAMRQADEALQNSIDEVQKNLDEAAKRLENLINVNITDIESLKAALAALDIAYKAADHLIRIDFKVADDELAKRIAALEAAMRQTDGTLKISIEEVQKKLDESTKRLEVLINSNESDIDELKKALAELDRAYKAADVLMNSEIALLKAKDEGLEKRILALETASKTVGESLKSGMELINFKLEKINDQLQNKDNILEERINHLASQNGRIKIAYMAINLSLALIVIVLTGVIVVMLVKMKKKRS